MYLRYISSEDDKSEVAQQHSNESSVLLETWNSLSSFDRTIE